jgi:hypothetical protein
VLVALVAGFLLIAILKPWSLAGDGSGDGLAGDQAVIPIPTPARGLATDGQAAPTAAPPIPDLNGMPCLADPTEQVVVLERWPGHEVRSWVAATDTLASGPLDDRLVAVPFFSTHVIGLGICAALAGTGNQQPAARLLDVQSIVETANGPRAIDLGIPDPITLRLNGSGAALLYGAPQTTPPTSSLGLPRRDPGASPAPTEQPGEVAPGGTGFLSPAGRLAAWPPGSYAIAFLYPSDGPNVMRWLRIDLIQGAGSAA